MKATAVSTSPELAGPPAFPGRKAVTKARGKDVATAAPVAVQPEAPATEATSGDHGEKSESSVKKAAAAKATAKADLKPAQKGAAPIVDAISDIKADAGALPPEKTAEKAPDPVVAEKSAVAPAAPPAAPRAAAKPAEAKAAKGETAKADAPKVETAPAPASPSAEDADGDAPEPVRPPLLIAKDESFAEGDYVVYPTHGVGKVEKIAVEDIAGHRLELIHITFEENRMTLRVPVAKARSAGLRKLATRKMFDEAMAVLKGRARIKRTMWSRRAQEYEAKINSGDPMAIAEVVRDLHRNAGQPDQSFSERQIYESAMDRLAAELAALDQTDKPTAATKLADFLKTVA